MVVITISGKYGTGKDTIGELLSKRIDFKLIKATMRRFAKERGLDILEFEKLYTKNSDEWDRKLDEWQRNVVKKEENSILVSHLSAYVVPDADLKIFLTASDEIRFERISKRDKIDSRKVEEYVRERESVFRKRVKRVYGIDYWSPKWYDLIVDTSNLSPEQIVDIIIEKLKSKKLIQS